MQRNIFSPETLFFNIGLVSEGEFILKQIWWGRIRSEKNFSYRGRRLGEDSVWGYRLQVIGGKFVFLIGVDILVLIRVFMLLLNFKTSLF